MLKNRLRRLKLKQVSEFLDRKETITISQLGEKITQIRSSLGMTQKQMAKRLGIKQPTYNVLEKHAEKSELKTVEKILAILNSRLLLVIAPDESLEKIVSKQAEKKAIKILSRAYSNMALEQQSPGKKNYEERLKELIEEIKSNPDSSLWED